MPKNLILILDSTKRVISVTLDIRKNVNAEHVTTLDGVLETCARLCLQIANTLGIKTATSRPSADYLGVTDTPHLVTEYSLVLLDESIRVLQNQDTQETDPLNSEILQKWERSLESLLSDQKD